MDDYLKKYNDWIEDKYFDQKTKNELKAIDDLSEIKDRFYKELEFGTGGLRAVLGSGTNRLNKYTIRRITKGYGNYLLSEFGKGAIDNGVVIAYDTRHNSYEFALETAKTFAALKIKSFLFPAVTTTPELSFSVPYLHAVGGIVITASHNPANYNGYKIYDKTGCQVTLKIAKEIISQINKVSDYSSIKIASIDSPYINYLNESIYDVFLDRILSELIEDKDIEKGQEKLRILYTPLHGAGRRPVINILKRARFKKLYTVKEQLSEDPDFSTVSSPNPENVDSFEIAIKKAKQDNIDLILGTDPDCDRVGILVKHRGDYIPLNGNQVGSLLVKYLTTILSKKNIKMKKPFIIKTIVTSELGEKIAKDNGVSCVNTLTGFKFIGEKINDLSEERDFLMGYEESFGYLIGKHARDKDGISSALIISRMAAFYNSKGKSLIDVLNELYEQHGYYKEELLTISINGDNYKVNSIMSNYRELKKTYLSGWGIIGKVDYITGVDDLPISDVIKFFFKDSSWLALRPSGTEPKIKIYLGSKGKNEAEASAKINHLKSFIKVTLEN